METARDLLRLHSLGEELDDFSLALREPRRSLDHGIPMARRRQNRADCFGTEGPSCGRFGKNLGRFFGRQSQPVAPGFGHGVIGIGCREDLRQGFEGGGAYAAVIARTVKSFVVERGNRSQTGKERRSQQDALRVIRMKPYPLPVVCSQWFDLLPDAYRCREATEVMHQSGTTNPDLVLGLG